MEGMKDLIGDEVKSGEESNDQLSSTVCVEQGEIKIEEDPIDHPFCVAKVTQEEVKVEEDPYDQLSSAACVKHSDEEER
jgi:hypothetical protein